MSSKSPKILPLLATLLALSTGARVEEPPAPVFDFLDRHCLDCHDGPRPKAGLNLEELAFDLESPESFRTWVRVHDALESGEMPPAKKPRPEAGEKSDFLGTLSGHLHEASTKSQGREGRVRYRRLNRFEYQGVLRDLLELPHLEVQAILPPDPSSHGFDNVGESLSLSHVQIARYLEAAETALDAAMALSPRPEGIDRRIGALEIGRFRAVSQKRREAVALGEAVGLLRQPNTAQAPWTWNRLQPTAPGIYRLRMKAHGFTWNRGEVEPCDHDPVISLYAKMGQRRRHLTSFDISPDPEKPTIHECEVYLEPGELLETYLATLDDRNKTNKVEMEDYHAPGVALEWLEVEGPRIEAWPPASHRRLLGDLPLEVWTPETGLSEPPPLIITTGVGKRARRKPDLKSPRLHVVSRQPVEDARRLLHDFLGRALRRPVKVEEVEPFLALVRAKIDQKMTFQEALRIGYKAILCSPDFLFVHEKPGRLDDLALATRLSLFVWSSLPDATLRELAEEGKLHEPETLRAQVERLLADPRSARFVESFTGQWLDLREIRFTEPDEQLYPEWDELLLESMVKETRAYFTAMIEEDLDPTHLVDSDFAMLNSRLAELYEIDGIEGISIRKVPLPEDSHRGGLLTQASLLKVTANGTTTSPVTRGAWVLDRILGSPAKPPPPGVPAIEPDVRGTNTVRELLEKHRSVPGCVSCHRSIDPPGFALERFDVMGGWRDRYRILGEGKKVKKKVRDRPVRYALGPEIDASGETPEGVEFDDFEKFREILLGQRERLARNLVERLVVYATGAPVQFADRKRVDAILERSRPRDHGFRSLIHEVVQSELFQMK